MAFVDGITLDLMLLDQIMNFLFFIDIILNFFTAFMDADFRIIDNHAVSEDYFCLYSILTVH